MLQLQYRGRVLLVSNVCLLRIIWDLGQGTLCFFFLFFFFQLNFYLCVSHIAIFLLVLLFLFLCFRIELRSTYFVWLDVCAV